MSRHLQHDQTYVHGFCSDGSSKQHHMGLVLVPHEQRSSCQLLVSALHVWLEPCNAESEWELCC